MSRRRGSSALAMVPVPFHGHTLHAVQDGEQVWVGVKSVCEGLGIDRATQQAKLQSKAWAVGGMKPLTGPDGKNYDTWCISLDSLPMWLATIEPSRVSEDIRPMLVAFQLEAAKVLRDYFFKGGAVNHNASPEQLDAILAKVTELTSDNARLVASVQTLNNSVLMLRHELDSNMGTIGADAAEREIKERIRKIVGILHHGDTSARASASAKMHNELRGVCSWANAKSHSWENLPRTEAAKAKVWLDREEAKARALDSRQIKLGFDDNGGKK